MTRPQAAAGSGGAAPSGSRGRAPGRGLGGGTPRKLKKQEFLPFPALDTFMHV